MTKWAGKFSSAIIHIFQSGHFLRFGFFLTLVNVLGGVLGYVFQILTGRFLLPKDFAVFSSLMALLMFFSAPMGAVSIIITRKVSKLKALNSLHSIRPILLKINKLLFFISIIIVAIFWVFSAQLQEYLRLTTPLPLILFCVIIIFSIFIVANSAFMQGLQYFMLLGILGLVATLLKLLISSSFVLMGFGIGGALLGMIFAMAITFIWSWMILIRKLPDEDVVPSNFDINLGSIKRLIPVFAATIGTAGMTQLDMVLVNWYFPSEQAGLYAAASVLGKAILYLPGGMIVALLPMVSERHASGDDPQPIFRQAISSTLLLCGAVATIYFIFGETIISLLYGPHYAGAGKILGWYGFAMLPLAFVVLAEYYLIAKGQVLFAWLFALIAPLQCMCIYFWHSELWMIVVAMAVSGGLLAVMGYGIMWKIGVMNLTKVSAL